jgi:hypothetical protein
MADIAEVRIDRLKALLARVVLVPVLTYITVVGVITFAGVDEDVRALTGPTNLEVNALIADLLSFSGPFLMHGVLEITSAEVFRCSCLALFANLLRRARLAVKRPLVLFFADASQRENTRSLVVSTERTLLRAGMIID